MLGELKSENEKRGGAAVSRYRASCMEITECQPVSLPAPPLCSSTSGTRHRVCHADLRFKSNLAYITVSPFPLGQPRLPERTSSRSINPVIDFQAGFVGATKNSRDLLRDRIESSDRQSNFRATRILLEIGPENRQDLRLDRFDFGDSLGDLENGAGLIDCPAEPVLARKIELIKESGAAVFGSRRSRDRLAWKRNSVSIHEPRGSGRAVALACRSSTANNYFPLVMLIVRVRVHRRIPLCAWPAFLADVSPRMNSA